VPLPVPFPRAPSHPRTSRSPLASSGRQTSITGQLTPLTRTLLGGPVFPVHQLPLLYSVVPTGILEAKPKSCRQLDRVPDVPLCDHDGLLRDQALQLPRSNPPDGVSGIEP